MNWKLKYKIVAYCLLSFCFGIVIAKSFIKPVIILDFAEHCLIKDIILHNSDFDKKIGAG